jgi:hypothetical protein
MRPAATTALICAFAQPDFAFPEDAPDVWGGWLGGELDGGAGGGGGGGASCAAAAEASASAARQPRTTVRRRICLLYRPMTRKALPLRTMELEITPEPTPEEREAIERALTVLRRERAASPWWASGLDQDTDGAEREP